MDQEGIMTTYFPERRESRVFCDRVEWGYRAGEMALEVFEHLPKDEDIFQYFLPAMQFRTPLMRDSADYTVHQCLNRITAPEPLTRHILRGSFLSAHRTADSKLWRDYAMIREYIQEINDTILKSGYLNLIGKIESLETCGDYIKVCLANCLTDISDFRRGFRALAAVENDSREGTDLKDASAFMEYMSDKFQMQDIQTYILRNEETGEHLFVHLIRDLRSLLAYEFCRMKESGYMIRICGNCGKFFFPVSRPDEKYCTRPLPGEPGKTCRSVGAEKRYRERIGLSEALTKYKREYVRISMRIQRMPPDGDKEKLQALLAYRDELKKKRNNLVHGDITDQEFISWIKSATEGRKA